MSVTRPAYGAFAAFGGFWGVWGAALPAVRDAAGVSAGQLGVALLFIGAGALPAMLVTGRAVDRFGGRVVAVVLVLLGVSGVAVGVLAAGPVSLAGLLLILGATSGAADVGANAVAGAAERAAGAPVLTRAHGVFSAAVVVSSLTTGGLQSLGIPVQVAFALVVVAAVLAAVPLWRLPPAASPAPSPAPTSASASAAAVSARRGRRLVRRPLLVAGMVGALAFAVENAHQSWGAVFLADELVLTGGLTAAAPAVFAGVAALTRFSIGALGRLPPWPVFTTGALVATAGSVLLARADDAPLALAGIALAAAGTSVLYPTVLAEVLRHVDDRARGRATSAVATTAYLGFLLGPVYVGALTAQADLRTAFLGVAGLAALAAVTAWPAMRWATGRTTGAVTAR